MTGLFSLTLRDYSVSYGDNRIRASMDQRKRTVDRFRPATRDGL